MKSNDILNSFEDKACEDALNKLEIKEDTEEDDKDA